MKKNLLLPLGATIGAIVPIAPITSCTIYIGHEEEEEKEIEVPTSTYDGDKHLLRNATPMDLELNKTYISEIDVSKWIDFDNKGFWFFFITNDPSFKIYSSIEQYKVIVDNVEFKYTEIEDLREKIPDQHFIYFDLSSLSLGFKGWTLIGNANEINDNSKIEIQFSVPEKMEDMYLCFSQMAPGI